MPFPWKKVKSTRISRLLNDHLHKSQKRRDGSSLVVETGFPTSLIDLFIKNREKLKNSSKKNRETCLSVPSQNDFDAPPIAGSPPSRMDALVIAGLPVNCSSPLRRFSPLYGVNDIDGGGAEVKCDADRLWMQKGVILLAVKIFLVAILALGAKRLTVGITMSAFLLCFLECAGKHLRDFLKPCSKPKGWLTSMLQKKLPKIGYKEEREEQEKGGASLWKDRREGSPRSGHSLKCCESRHRTRNIEIEKPNQCPITLIYEIQPEKEIMEDFCLGGRSSRHQENEVVIGEEKSLFEVRKLKRKSRKDKIKSKMKLFVPKKFGSLRKGHNFRGQKVVQEDKVAVDEGTDGWESDATSRLSSTSSGGFKEEDDMDSIYALGGLREFDEEVGGKETGSGMSWSYLVLCLTLLTGLIGGRAFALFLTLSWFLVLKLSKTLTRYRDVTMLKSFDDWPG
ncbi:hypothetical protein F511_25681 [Dorcoceras hygrometricum]|uniref:Ethylene-responsive nuclear family protein n=1 Tax=Dorcoceras hygrometricum TaxID=472368 RepID=A0A2Z7C2M1_9LAMI|nr:hypothetical protein F511_25681 [Dorcoceras hygrometricum]